MISIFDLEKKFGKLEILKKINLEIAEGKITAIVGSNGSGKSTIMKSILGLVKPDRGEIVVDGITINDNYSYREKIGYMPQIARYPDNLSIIEVVSMLKDLRNSELEINPEILDAFNLYSELEKPFRTLSGGTKQKVNVLIAFLFNPKILFLDEPTSGLDPVSSSNFKDMIRNEKEKGKTIVLTSHIMSDIQELADDIAFLIDGKIKFNGTIDSFLFDRREESLERAIARLMTEVPA